MRQLLSKTAFFSFLCSLLISCSKSEGEGGSSMDVVGTWNKVSVDVYFDGTHIQNIPIGYDYDAGVVLFTEDGSEGADIQDSINSQITFNSNGTGTILWVTFKYSVKGNTVIIDKNSLPKTWDDDYSELEFVTITFNKKQLSYTVTYKGVYEYYTCANTPEDMKIYGADGKNHVVKYVETYEKI